MQRYVVDTSLDGKVRLFGKGGEPVDLVPGDSYYDASDADAELAAKDRDLTDANHALLLANNSADAFRRVAEQRQGEIERLRRAVEWCLDHGASRDEEGVFCVAKAVVGINDPRLEVPAEFADIIKPTTGASNG